MTSPAGWTRSSVESGTQLRSCTVFDASGNQFDLQYSANEFGAFLELYTHGCPSYEGAHLGLFQLGAEGADIGAAEALAIVRARAESIGVHLGTLMIYPF